MLMILHTELNSTWQEEVVANLRVPYRHFPADIVESHKKFSQVIVYRLIFEVGTSRIRLQKLITLGTACTVRKYGGNQKQRGTVLVVLKKTQAKPASVYPSLTN
jgi:hypothetical protein